MSSERPGAIALLALCVTGFCVLSSYELARSSVESMFLSAHTEHGVPWAWLLVAPSVIATVAVYNHFIGRHSLIHVFVGAIATTAAVLVALLGALSLELPGVYYALYVWKDVYIVVLIELIWTVANSQFTLKSAKWLYGLFLVVGSIGAICGGMSVGPIARAWGSAGALWAVVPLMAVAACAVTVLGRHITTTPPDRKRPPPWGDSLRVLRDSRYLSLLLVLVVCMQITINLVDFEYQRYLRIGFADEVERTAFHGQVNSAINMVALVLQLGSGLVFSTLGISTTLIGVPVVLAGTVAAFSIRPGVMLVSAAKVAAKSLDYSLNKAAKEMLYIPLPLAERTRGKAVVDIMTYRLAKATAAAVVLALTTVGAEGGVTAMAFVTILCWIGLIRTVTRRFDRVREEQAAS